MKTILTLLAILGAQFIAAPEADARPHSPTHRYVISRTSCGCPIYTQRYVAYYDRCGQPVFRYRTEPIVHRCRPVQRQQHPAYRTPYHRGYNHRDVVRPSCGIPSSHGRTIYRRTSIYGFPR